MRRRQAAEPVPTKEDNRELYLNMSAEGHRKLAVALLVDSEYQAFAPAAGALAARAQVHALLALSAPPSTP